MPTPEEPDFLPGHPKRFDYDPASPEAKEWARKNIHPRGERDWPVDSIHAIDTPGNKNAVPVRIGEDPAHPELEAFSGRTAVQVAGARAAFEAAARAAQVTAAREPGIAPPPPTPLASLPPTGQPGVTVASRQVPRNF